jgi:hypothetical protein
MLCLSRQDHPSYDKHDALLKAIWNLDRSAQNPETKLAQVQQAIAGGSNPWKLFDMFDEGGASRAQVPPLIIACFEGDYDLIKYLLHVSFSSFSFIWNSLKIFHEEWCWSKSNWNWT